MAPSFPATEAAALLAEVQRLQGRLERLRSAIDEALRSDTEGTPDAEMPRHR